jgi:enolase-phosphatase E1
LPARSEDADEAPSTYPVDAVLLDIEGTISPLSYVRDVLFPFAAARLREFVRQHERDPDVAALLDESHRASGGEDALAALEKWHRDDVKAPPLKTLQGLIWAEGYAQGAFVSPVYPDALDALRRWQSEGVRLFVYSSGSLQAQDLFFRYSSAGDLRGLFSGHYDTTTGPKTLPQSYELISGQIGLPPGAILFCSDNPAELAAAETAGLLVAHIVKDGGQTDPRWRSIDDFAQIHVSAHHAGSRPDGL